MGERSRTDAALSFLTAQTHFRSSAVLEAVQARFAAAEDQAMAFFQVPLREKLLSFEDALLWLAYMQTQAEKFPAGFDLAAALDAVLAMYDLAVDDLLLCHTLDEDEPASP